MEKYPQNKSPDMSDEMRIIEAIPAWADVEAYKKYRTYRNQIDYQREIRDKCMKKAAKAEEISRNAINRAGELWREIARLDEKIAEIEKQTGGSDNE